MVALGTVGSLFFPGPNGGKGEVVSVLPRVMLVLFGKPVLTFATFYY